MIIHLRLPRACRSGDYRVFNVLRRRPGNGFDVRSFDPLRIFWSKPHNLPPAQVAAADNPVARQYRVASFVLIRRNGPAHRLLVTFWLWCRHVKVSSFKWRT